MKIIDDFDELINLRTLAHHFLVLEPSPYVLQAIAREEKSKFLVLAYSFLREFSTNILFYKDDD